MFDKLRNKLGDKPSRDDVLGAVSAAFDGAKVEPMTDSWSLHIDTDPPRVIDVTNDWLQTYVEEQRLSTSELEEHFRHVRNSGHWAELPNGRGLAFLCR